jgi:hypothetical protein
MSHATLISSFSLNAISFHELGNPVLAAAFALLPQFLADTWASIGAGVFFMHCPYSLDQPPLPFIGQFATRMFSLSPTEFEKDMPYTVNLKPAPTRPLRGDGHK